MLPSSFSTMEIHNLNRLPTAQKRVALAACRGCSLPDFERGVRDSELFDGSPLSETTTYYFYHNNVYDPHDYSHYPASASAAAIRRAGDVVAAAEPAALNSHPVLPNHIRVEGEAATRRPPTPRATPYAAVTEVPRPPARAHALSHRRHPPHQLSPLPEQDLPLLSPLALESPVWGRLYAYPLPVAPQNPIQNAGKMRMRETQMRRPGGHGHGCDGRIGIRSGEGGRRGSSMDRMRMRIRRVRRCRWEVGSAWRARRAGGRGAVECEGAVWELLTGQGGKDVHVVWGKSGGVVPSMSCSRAESAQQREREGAVAVARGDSSPASCTRVVVPGALLCSVLPLPASRFLHWVSSPSFPVSSSARRLALAKSSLLWGHCMCGAALRGAVGSIVLRSGDRGAGRMRSQMRIVWTDGGRKSESGYLAKALRPSSPFLGTELRMRRARRAVMCDNDVGPGHRFEARPRGSRWRSSADARDCFFFGGGAVRLSGWIWSWIRYGRWRGYDGGWRRLTGAAVFQESWCGGGGQVGISLLRVERMVRGSGRRKSSAAVLCSRASGAATAHGVLPRGHHGTDTGRSTPPSTSASPPTSPSIHPSSSSTLPPISLSAPSHSVTEHEPTGSGSGGWATWSRRPRDPAHGPGRDHLPAGAAAAGRRGVRKSGWDAAAVATTCASGEGEQETGRGWGGSGEHLGGGRVEEGGGGCGGAGAGKHCCRSRRAVMPSSSTDYTDTRTTGMPVTTGTPGTVAAFVCYVRFCFEGRLTPAASTSASSPSPDAAPAAPPPKKSTAAAAGPQNGKQKLGGLPTSSVVGFSIPTAGAGSGAAESAKNRAALRALLTAPAVDAAASTPKSFADASASATPATSKKTREERPHAPRARQHGQHVLHESERGPGRWGRRGRGAGPGCRSAKKPVNGGAAGKGKGKGKKRLDGMQGGHQEDAEEFLGFFLDMLEEELSAVVAGLSPTSSASASKRVAATPSADGTGRVVVEEREEEAPPETEDGWIEVGRKNRTVVTRTAQKFTGEKPKYIRQSRCFNANIALPPSVLDLTSKYLCQ
ncbi:hypothetical protein B0H14DRAFT_3135359 [Mycena olivaceomarginata]|nr:hypothetical protein B0H14DRAFT_3135359 [Mycena olivaceomarginata]